MFVEVKRDLFTMPEDYYRVHCIASDLGMGAGIAVPMNKKYKIRSQIQQRPVSLVHPTVVLTGNVFNLITKARSSGKPTFISLKIAVQKMKGIIDDLKIKKVTMPLIGCGLDRLQWGEVRQMLIDELDAPDMDIVVCIWD